MAFYRQLLVITVPSVAVLFGIYWYRRKRGYTKNDPGGNIKNPKTLEQELEEATNSASAAIPIKCQNQNGSYNQTPTKLGKSAPIDILPNGIHSQRSSLQLTDKQLDLEIEKAKSEKLHEMDIKRNSKENTPTNSHSKSILSKSTSPQNGTAVELQRKFSPKNDTPVISCLADQLMHSKLREMEESPSEECAIDSTPPTLSNGQNNQTVSSPLNHVVSDVSKDKQVDDRKLCNLSVISNTESQNVAPVEEVVVVKKIGDVCNGISSKSSSAPSEKTTKGNKRSKRNKPDKLNTVNTKSFVENNVDSHENNANSSHSNIPENGEEENDTLCNNVSRNDVNISNSSETEPRNIDRDSANHSPSDAMLASPAISHFSDNHSEGSNDSGKGCSESPSPPPPHVNDVAINSGYIMHQFLAPQNLVGYLIGSKKNFINKLNSINGAKVRIRPHPTSPLYQVCSVHGTQSDVDVILDMIRVKVPDKKFQKMIYKDVSLELYEIEMSYMAECYHLSLVEGVNNDTTVSCYVSPSQLFLQQPTHPTYPSLHILHNLMGTCYQDTTIPSLPTVLSVGMVCAAPTANNWYRTQIISINNETNTSLVKLVDFGGFMSVENSLLKQIRKDFMMLPFQAIEVQLADIAPVDDEWSADAVQVIAGITTGQLLQAQVVGYDEFGTPQVYLYLTLAPQHVILLNQELVVRGLAQWIAQES